MKKTARNAALIVMMALLPSYAYAGFMTGAVVGAGAMKMACTPCQKELACIKAAFADPAWKGHEDKIVETCEAELKKKPAMTVKPPAQ